MKESLFCAFLKVVSRLFHLKDVFQGWHIEGEGFLQLFFMTTSHIYAHSFLIYEKDKTNKQATKKKERETKQIKQGNHDNTFWTS